MQISRPILLACAVAGLFLPLTLPAQDNDAQAKARKALEQSTKESPEPPAAPAPAPAAPAARPAQPQKPAPAPVQPPPAAAKPKPPIAATPAAPAPVAATPASSTLAPARPPIAPAPAPVVPVYEPPPATAAQTQRTEPQTGQSTGVFADPETLMHPGAKPEALDQARAAVRQDAWQPQSPPPQAPKAAPRAKDLQNLPPLPLPPPAVSGTKEVRLQELLDMYREDRIAPEVYHAQRAKILAEP